MTDRNALLAELADQRRLRGAAVIDGLPFDASRIAEIAVELDIVEDVELAEQHNDLAIAAAARNMFVLARRHEVVVADQERVAALDAAEAACRSLAVAVKRYLAAHQALAASGARLGLDIPIPITGRTPAILVSCLIGETLREVAPEGGHIGNLELPRWPAVERPASWRAADAAADVAVKYLLESPAPVEFQGEHQ
jgi:hypothetical protein